MSYRRKPIGWYTKDGKHRPIMSSSRGKRSLPKLGHDVLRYSRPLSYQLPKPEQLLENFVLDNVLSQSPIISEIQTAYLVADSLYDNWNTITEIYKKCKKEDWRGVAKLIGSDIVRGPLSSFQTDLVWAAIVRFVPDPIKDKGKEMLSTIMDKVTSAELSFVTQFLTEQNNKTRKKVGPRPKRYCSTYYYPNRKKKIPDDVNRV